MSKDKLQIINILARNNVLAIVNYSQAPDSRKINKFYLLSNTDECCVAKL